MMTLPRLKICVLAIAVGALSACVNVLPEASPAAARFLVSSVEFTTPASEQVSWSLAVTDPTATRAYDTAKIAITRSPGQIEYYAAGEWADRAPTLVKIALVRSFENSGRVLGVGDMLNLPGADYIVQTDVRSLHVRAQDGPSTAQVDLFVRVTDKRGRILASKLFKQEQALASDSAASAAQAFNVALSKSMAKIVDWSVVSAEKANQAKYPTVAPISK